MRLAARGLGRAARRAAVLEAVQVAARPLKRAAEVARAVQGNGRDASPLALAALRLDRHVAGAGRALGAEHLDGRARQAPDVDRVPERVVDTRLGLAVGEPQAR